MIATLRGSAAFARIRAEGSRASSGPLTVHGAPADQPAVAFAIGRKVGKAVKRNQLRRRCKEILRTLPAGDLPSAHLVISARPAAATLSFDQLQEHLVQALHLWKTRRNTAIS